MGLSKVLPNSEEVAADSMSRGDGGEGTISSPECKDHPLSLQSSPAAKT